VRQLTAVLGILWAVLNAVVAGFFLVSSFTAETAKKEGILAQGALLIGGALILLFGWLLAQQSWRLLRHRTSA
jgi:hypothetical protein